MLEDDRTASNIKLTVISPLSSSKNFEYCSVIKKVNMSEPFIYFLLFSTVKGFATIHGPFKVTNPIMV